MGGKAEFDGATDSRTWIVFKQVRHSSTFWQKHVGYQIAKKLLILLTANQHFWPVRNGSDCLTFPLGFHPQCCFYWPAVESDLNSKLNCDLWVCQCWSGAHAGTGNAYLNLSGIWMCNLTYLWWPGNHPINKSSTTSLLLLYCHRYPFFFLMSMGNTKQLQLATSLMGIYSK